MKKRAKKGCALLLAAAMTVGMVGTYNGGAADVSAAASTQKQYYDISSGKSVLLSSKSSYEILSTAGEYTVDGKQVALYKRGDADKTNDGKLTSQDLIAIKKLENTAITSVAGKAADVNSDGKVDSDDAAWMRKALVKNYKLTDTTKGESLLGQGVMPIVGYYAPTDAASYDTVADLGINTVVLNTEDVSDDDTAATAVLSAAEKKGIKVYLNNWAATDPDSSAAISDDDTLAAYNVRYDSYASFAGYYLSDGVYLVKSGTSASGNIYANNGIAQYKDVLKSIEKYQNISAYFNLLPYNSVALSYSFGGDENGSITQEEYAAYVKAAAKAGADYLSYDLLLRDDASDTLNQEAFYRNLDWIRTVSMDETVDKPFHGMVQVGSYYDTENTEDVSTDKLPNISEMYLQASAALAMGAKGIRYNVLSQPKAYAENVDNDDDPYDYNRSGLISYNGAANTGKSDNYNYYQAAKNMNAYISAVDNVLMQAENKGVIATDSTIKGYLANSAIDSYGALKSVTGNNALVGCFDYIAGDVYVAANTSTTAGTTVTLTFDETISGELTAFDGTVTAVNGKEVTVTLNAGQSAMLLLGTVTAATENGNQEEEDTGYYPLLDTVEKAAELKNTVQAYYTGSDRTAYVVENPSVKVQHGTKQLDSISNANGTTYLGENAVDVYVTYNGTKYYSSNSSTNMNVNTIKLGYYYYEAKLQNLDFGSSVPNLYLEKTYHTYADKMNQTVRIIKTKQFTESNLTNAGFKITIPKSDVSKVIYDGTEAANITAETAITDYIGFDMKNAGVIGFIMTGQGTTNKVTVDDSNYYLWQEVTPSFEGYTDAMLSNFGNGDNCANGDFSFANRTYTDTTHNFSGLKQAVYEEKNPLTGSNIVVEDRDYAKFSGYDYLTGAYAFELNGTDFGTAYNNPQLKFYEHITVKNVPDDRLLWLHVHTAHDLEAAVVTDGTTQIPIAMQTSKNFANENILAIYEADEATWGDSYMPLSVSKEEEYDFNIVHLYQTWGASYPLKQLSSIEYYDSYYHLSNGLTETNCIAPYYSANASGVFDFSWFLPDFRGASCDWQYDTAANFTSYIQKRSVGTIYAPGPATANKKAPAGVADSANYTDSQIASSGMTYAELDYTYEAADGAYEYTMRHVEMPQTDEARTRYQITFNFKQDTTLSASNFQILGMDGRVGSYTKMSYMNTEGSMKDVTLYKKSIITTWDNAKYSLQSGSSYFACYGLDSAYKDSEAGNVGVIICDDGGQQLAVQTKKSSRSGTDITYCYLTFNSETTFKANTSYTVDLILLPYGSAVASDYTSVAEVYEDSVTNPLQVTAATGTVKKDVIPTVEAVDNEAEFTVSNGTNSSAADGINYTAKVTGFDSNFAPTVYEKVNGEWVVYKYATDAGWDGYGVEYEKESGTYAYSFVFTKKIGEDRTFKVVKAASYSVNYYVDHQLVKTKKYAAGEAATEPASAELGVEGYKTLSYYRDIAGVESFTHGTVLNEDTDVYVMADNEMYITPDMLMNASTNKSADSGYSKALNEDGSITITGPNDSQTYLKGLGINVNRTSTVYMKLKVSEVTNVRMFVLGEFELDGIQYNTSEENWGEGNGYADGVAVGTQDADGYTTYKFEFHQWTGSGNSNPLYFSKIDGFNFSMWTGSTGALQIAEIYTKTEETSTGNVTVTYSIGTHTTTETIAAGSKISEPKDLAKNPYTYGRKIMGYYADAEFTKKYDFGNWVYGDTTVYVKLSENFYLNPILCTMSAADESSIGASNLSATLSSDNKVIMAGSHGGYWQVTCGQIWTNVKSDDVMIMKVKGDGANKYLFARVWGTSADNTEKAYPGYKMCGTKVGTDTEGYSIYEFPDITQLSVIKGIRLDAYGAMTADDPFELAYFKVKSTYSNTAKVNYYLGEDLKYTDTVTKGEAIAQPDSTALGITDKKVCGFYTDADLSTEYDFTQAVTEDLELYIQTKDYLNIGMEFWQGVGLKGCTLAADSANETLVFTKTDTGEMYINRLSLDYALKDNQKIRLVAKLDGITGIMAYPIGTYVQDGKTITITGATGGYNWWFSEVGTTEDGFTIYEMDLSQANDSGNAVAFDVITGIRIDLTGGETDSTFTFKQLYCE